MRCVTSVWYCTSGATLSIMERAVRSPERDIARLLAGGDAGARIFGELLAENDRLVFTAAASAGRSLAAARTSIHTGLFRAWLAPLVARFGASSSFLAMAIGGTGRREMAPRSDFDVGYLVLESAVSQALLREIERQTVHGGDFERAYGFAFRGQIIVVQDISALTFEQTTSLLDMRWLLGPPAMVHDFRQALAHSVDPLVRYLRHERLLRDYLADSPREGIDLKLTLRRFQAALWLRGSPLFQALRTASRTLDANTIDAYWLVHRMRAVCHQLAAKAAARSASAVHPDRVSEAAIDAAVHALVEANSADRSIEYRALHCRVMHALECIDAFAQRTLAVSRQHAPAARRWPVTVTDGGLVYCGPPPEGNAARRRYRDRAALSRATPRHAGPTCPCGSLPFRGGTLVRAAARGRRPPLARGLGQGAAHRLGHRADRSAATWGELARSMARYVGA